MNRKHRRAGKTQGKPSTLGVDVQRVFADAVRHHQVGRLRESEMLYRKILEIDPRHADSLHFLGVMACQVGRQDLGIDLIAKAIKINAGIAPYHFNLGNAFQDLGQSERAADCYRRAIDLKPDDAAAFNNLGNALRNLGQLDEAAVCFRKALALSSSFADAHDNLGNVLMDMGRVNDAIVCYNNAIRLERNRAQTHYNLGNALCGLGQFGEATNCLRMAIALKPDFIDAHNNLGNALRECGRLDEAAACFRRVLDLNPDHALAHSGLGSVLWRWGQFDGAAISFRRALHLRPDLAEAHAGLGVALAEMGRLEEAVACQRRALALKPDDVDALHNLGTSLMGLDQLSEAIENCHQAIGLKPDFADCHFNLGMAYLFDEDFTRGWEEYEWRLKRQGEVPGRFSNLPQHMWSGDRGDGRTILLWTEQGAGDSIQFVRYIQEVLKLGWNVILEAPSDLKALFNGIEGVSLVDQGGGLPHFDVHCPLLSLPRIFGTVLETIPAGVPYLAAEEDCVAVWRERLRQEEFGHGEAGVVPRIGLVWAGNPAFRHDAARSPRLGAIAPLLAVKGVEFFGLQMGDGRRDLADYAMPPSFTDLASHITDFADTAAIIANLDLVITSDTSVAHLAGALGKPVWVMLQAVPDWRWLRDRDDSPWYPSMRLFRQAQRGDWLSVMDAVIRELKLFVSSRLPGGLRDSVIG